MLPLPSLRWLRRKVALTSALLPVRDGGLSHPPACHVGAHISRLCKKEEDQTCRVLCGAPAVSFPPIPNVIKNVFGRASRPQAWGTATFINKKNENNLNKNGTECGCAT